MYVLHRIGPRVNSNFNTIEEIMRLPRDTPLSFDGVYTEVADHLDQLKEFTDVTLFPCGMHAGTDNSFDVGQPPGRFLMILDVTAIANAHKWKLGWHSWTHEDLTELSDDELQADVKPLSKAYFGDTFCYPYGKFDKRVIDFVRAAGYKEAYGVFRGDGSDFQKTRKYLNW